MLEKNQILEELFPPAVVTPPPPVVTPPLTETTCETPKQSHQDSKEQDTQQQEPILCMEPDTGIQQEISQKK